MPAIAEEVEAAIKEGVHFIFHAQPAAILGRKQKVQSIECLKTRPGKPDASGRSTPVPIKGSNFTIKADRVLWAVGEKVDLTYLPEGLSRSDGLIAVDDWGRTQIPRIFAGGDAATGEGYVSLAIASGKRSALAIDRYLRGEETEPMEEAREAVSFDRINLDYFPRKTRVKIPILDVSKRGRTFQEIHGGLTEGRARGEAERCFSCGNCIRCNVCLMVCPDVAIAFQGPENGYLIDYDHCKGCGICAVECPRSAMALEEEKWNE
jgi:formate dehydrogenase (NADP+) beta subunit